MILSKCKNGILAITERVREHHLFSFAATSAFFLLMSFIPFILVLLVLIRYTSLSETDTMNAIIEAVPSELENFMALIVREVYTKSITLVPISLVIALWSASKAFHALTYGLDQIHEVNSRSNWFSVRLRSMLYTLIFMLLILLLLFLMVFGKGVDAGSKLQLSHFMRFVISNRYILSCIGLTVLFVFMYCVLPHMRTTVSEQVPGAIIVGIGWTAFSWVLSIFYSPRVMNTYGSMTAIILAMVWMYFCMYFFLVGAELNHILMLAPENNLILGTLRDIAFAAALRQEDRMRNDGIQYTLKRKGTI